jgi:hypothetical protein
MFKNITYQQAVMVLLCGFYCALARKPTVESLGDSMDLLGRRPEFFYGRFLPVCEILAENPRNFAQRGVNPRWLRYLAPATVRKSVKTRAKLFHELRISCLIGRGRRPKSREGERTPTDSLLFGTRERATFMDFLSSRVLAEMHR